MWLRKYIILISAYFRVPIFGQCSVTRNKQSNKYKLSPHLRATGEFYSVDANFHHSLPASSFTWYISSLSLSNAWKWKVKVKSLSRVRPSATPWTAAYQAPLSMGFSRQEYWSGVPLPSPLYLCTMLLIYWQKHLTQVWKMLPSNKVFQIKCRLHG